MKSVISEYKEDLEQVKKRNEAKFPSWTDTRLCLKVISEMREEVKNELMELLEKIRKEQENYVWEADDWDAGFSSALDMFERMLVKEVEKLSEGVDN